MVECFSNMQEALGSVTSTTVKQPNPDECSLSSRGFSLQAKLSRVKLPLEPCRGDPGSLSSFWSCQGSGDMFLEQSLNQQVPVYLFNLKIKSCSFIYRACLYA